MKTNKKRSRRLSKSKSKKLTRKHRYRTGGETDQEIRTRRNKEIEDKKMSAMERGVYMKPDNTGPIVNQNQDIHELNRNYNDNIDFEDAKDQGLTFGGKIMGGKTMGGKMGGKRKRKRKTYRKKK